MLKTVELYLIEQQRLEKLSISDEFEHEYAQKINLLRKKYI